MLVEKKASFRDWPLISLQIRLRGDPPLILVAVRQKSGFEDVGEKD
jgi:hypothetical protein